MKSLLRSTFALAFVCYCLLFTAQPATAGLLTSMDDIQLWAGTGPNRAALIIDWADGKVVPGQTAGQSLAWGFRWENGQTPTGEDMLRAIDAIDVRLSISYQIFGGSAFVFGIGYDLDNDGSTFNFVLSPASASTSDSNPADDHLNYAHQAGAEFLYFAYYSNLYTTPGTALPTAGQLEYMEVDGVSDRHLVNGSWDALVINGNDQVPPVTPLAAAPEPTSAMLLLLGAVGLIGRRRHRR